MSVLMAVGRLAMNLGFVAIGAAMATESGAHARGLLAIGAVLFATRALAWVLEDQ